MNTEDRELLEMAAKAADFVELRLDPDGKPRARKENGVAGDWNPLEDDGDALQLAVKLGLCITFVSDGDSVQVYQQNEYAEAFNVHVEAMDDYGTRRAIVRAAAEIGRAMP